MMLLCLSSGVEGGEASAGGGVGLLEEPVAVVVGELVVAGACAFEAGDRGWPDVEVACGGFEGEGFADSKWSQVGGVRDCGGGDE